MSARMHHTPLCAPGWRSMVWRIAPAALLLLAGLAQAAPEDGGAVPVYSDLQREAQKGSFVQPAAREGDTRPLLKEDSALRTRAQEILKGPEFAPEETTHTLKFKKERKPEADKPRPAWLKALDEFFRKLGDFSRVLIWVGGAILLLILLFSLHYWWRMTAPGRVRSRVALPTEVGGLDIRPESLPDDVAAAALAAWERGDRVQALSLLYRGALSALVVRHAAAIRASSTEQECVRAARKVVSADAAESVARLTQARLLAIYAQRWPTTEIVRALCSEYSQHFAAAQPGSVDNRGLPTPREAA
jgi:hypothetical protein